VRIATRPTPTAARIIIPLVVSKKIGEAAFVAETVDLAGEGEGNGSVVKEAVGCASVSVDEAVSDRRIGSIARQGDHVLCV
jgi:hypothetical protein